jgi:hypothetical protein
MITRHNLIRLHNKNVQTKKNRRHVIIIPRLKFFNRLKDAWYVLRAKGIACECYQIKTPKVRL